VRAVSEGWWRGGGVKNYAHALVAGKSRACVLSWENLEGFFSFLFCSEKTHNPRRFEPEGCEWRVCARELQNECRHVISLGYGIRVRGIVFLTAEARPIQRMPSGEVLYFP
jgi:hypothetical protein